MHQVFGNKKAIAVFVVPALILYILVGFFPILQSMYYSLLDWDGIQPAKFIGLASYKDFFLQIRTAWILIIRYLIRCIWQFFLFSCNFR